MATAGDGRAPYESGGAGGKFRKRPFRRSAPATPYDRPPTALRTNNRSLLTKIVDPASKLLYAGAHRLFDVFRKRLPPLSLQGRPESNEEPQNGSQESGQDVNNCSGVLSTDQGGNSASISAATGISELEQMLQQKTFTRSEIHRLTSLLHSRTSDDIIERDVAKPLSSPSFLRLEASTGGSLKKYGERDNFHAAISTPIVTSRVLEEETASPAELAKSYMGSRPTKVAPSALGLTSQTFRQDSKLLSKAPVTPVAPKTANSFKGLENGFMTPRSRGRSAMYSMARTPYSRSPTSFSQKGIRSEYGHGAPATSQSALGDEGKMVLKRRSSLLEDDIGSGGPLRRVRQKANLFSLREKKELGYPSFQQSDDVNQKLLLTNKPEPKVSGYASVPTKSTQTANKILQQLEKLSPNEKSSGLTPAGMREKSRNELTLDMLHGQALRSLEKADSPKLLCNPHDIQKPEVQQHARLHDIREPTSQIKDKIEENGSRKFPIPRNMLTSVNGDSTTEYIKDKAPIVGITKLTPKVAEPPQKKRAFQMSAPEDSFEIDDDILDNGHMSYPLAEISKAEASLVANKSAAADDIIETSKSAEVLRTPALVENNKPVFPEVAKVQEETKLKEAKLAASSPKSDVGMFGGSVSEQKIGFNLPTSPSPATTTQTSVISQSTLETEKVAPEGSSFSFGTGVEKVSSAQLYANQSSESQQKATSDLKAHDSISVFNSVTKNDHVIFSAPSKDEIGNGSKYEGDQKSANMFGKSVASAVPAATSTNGTFLFGNPSTKLSSPNITSTSSTLAVSASAFGASTNPIFNNSSPNVTSASTTTTTAAAIFSTSEPTPAFGFGSATSTVSKTSNAEIGNFNVINGKEPKVNMTTSPFGTSFATSTTTAGSGLFGFSSPAAVSTTITTTGSGLSGFSSPVVPSTTTATTTTIGKNPFGFSSSAATSTTTTTTGSGIFGFSSSAATSTATTTTGSGIFGFSSPAATSTTTTTPGNGLFGFSSPAATSTTTTTSGLFGFSSPAATSTTTSAQSQGSFFNITSGSQANTQASAAVSFAFGSSTPSSGSYSFSSSTPAFGSSPSFGNGSVAASSEGKSGNSTSGSTTTSIFGSTWQAPQQSSAFGSTFTSSSSSPVFSFGASSTPMFGSSNATSSFMTAGTTNSSFAGPSVFGNATPAFGASPNNNNTNNNNDHMSMEDSMAEDSMQTPSPVSSFGQAPVTAPGFMFGSPTPNPVPATVPFQFAGQMNQNQAQTQNPFQSSSLEFNAGGGSFSLGSGGEKSGRRIVRVVKSKNRKK